MDAQNSTKASSRARRRAGAIACVFVAVQILVVLFGTVGLEGINILRAYAAGESRWSRAQKSAVISLHRFAQTRSQNDYRDFEQIFSVIDGDRTAREILQHVNLFGTAAERKRAEQGFIQGGNSAADAPGLVWGFLLFHRWPTFGEAVADWTRGDNWTSELFALGSKMHQAAARDATQAEMSAYLSQVSELDDKLSRNELGYAQHMGNASHIAEHITFVMFVTSSILACGIGILFVWRITRAGMRAETRAAKNEARVRDFAELASDWFCELDKDLRVDFVATRFSAQDNDEGARITGRYWLEAGLTEGFRPLSNGQHEEALAAHAPFRGHRFRQKMPDGQVLHWSISGKPRFDADGVFAGFRIGGTDVTSMVRTQDELVRARDEAQRANQAKSAFLANMSHELRTPLNAILGFSGFIEHEAMGEIANKRYVEYAGDIRESGEHLLAIINDLLEHSRIEAGKAELREGQFDITAAIEQARLICQARAMGNNVTLVAHTAHDLPLIYGDELRLRQVLINLVSNAVKFTPGGTVDIVARLNGVGDLCVEVRDTGIGMDEAGVAQALKPFGQVDSGLNRKFEGTGLGLPLAKSLVELHGGTLAIESKEGTGTVVSVVLPGWRVGAVGPNSAAVA
ncbi:MAG TPA: ATP-binding protein [Rhizomicrobium sp.]|jgi:signal transduction histidine kinase